MPKREPPRWRRLPTINETAEVSEPGAPDFITVRVIAKPGEEPKPVNYVRQDTLPANLRKQVGKAIVEKVIGLPIFKGDQSFGDLGRKLMLDDDQETPSAQDAGSGGQP